MNPSTLSAIFLFTLFTINLQAKDYQFERFSSQDGLSQNIVLDIYKDHEGLVWIGTFDGLNLYDGYEFKIFRKEKGNSIVGNRVHCLAEDQNNNIWIGTMDEGVSVYNKITGTFLNLQNTEEQPDLLTCNDVRSILIDSHGAAWIGTLQGLNMLTQRDDGTFSVKKFVHDPKDPKSLRSNQVIRIYEDWDGRIWVTTNFSVGYLEYKDNQIKDVFTNAVLSEAENGFSYMQQVHFGYLVADFNGTFILRFNAEHPEESTYENLPSHSSYSFVVDPDSNLWVGGFDGIHLFRYTGNLAQPYVLDQTFTSGENDKTLSHNFVRSMLLDNTGILWMGTQGKGFMKCNTHKTTFRQYRHTPDPGSIPTNKVWTFYEDQETNMLLLGTEGGGVSMLNLDHGKNYSSGFTSYNVSPAGEQNFAYDIEDISRDGVKTYLIGNGFHQMVSTLEQRGNNWIFQRIFTQLDRQVMVVFQDENKTLWLGSYEGGLARYSPDKEQLTRFTNENSKLATNIIRSITEDSRGRLWIGTDKGLMLLTRDQKVKQGMEFTLFTHNPDDSTTLSNSYCVPVLETASGEIWVGTFGGGLNRYHEGSNETNGYFTSIQQKDGLPNNTIKSLEEDLEGNIWVASNGGLSRLNPGRNSIRNFSSYDGIQDLEYTDLSSIRLSDGELLFGGINGFNAFYPNEISEDTLVPRIVFMGLDIDNKPVVPETGKNCILAKNLNYLTELKLNHSQNNFTLHFAALQYTLPKGNVCKYMLEGVDADWITVGSEIRFARYAGIAPGKYTFRIMAANSNGIWTPETRSLELIITPPFWQTWWFRILAVAAISALVVLFTYQKRMQRRREKIELQKQVKQGMSLVEQSKQEVEKTREEIEMAKEALRQKELEDQEILFFNKGLAEFSDLISGHKDIDTLCRSLIVKLCEYLGIQLGNLFVLADDPGHDSEQVLKHISTYGGRIGNDYLIGESLVGTSFQRGEVITLDTIPTDSVYISSGLGKQVPGFICYIPIIHTDRKVGVFELASFKALDPFKVSFVNKLGEQIGSSILLMRAMQRNKKMVAEVQEKAEAMKSQEEMLRLNMEELLASQEEQERNKKKQEARHEELKMALHAKELENKKLQETMTQLETENEELRDKLEVV